jgi:CheY-like chemotaxis protein
MQEICARANLGFECAPDLATANGLILRETYDLVFLDVRLPDGDGHQFLERLMTLPDRPIVVLVTGAGSIESAAPAGAAGQWKVAGSAAQPRLHAAPGGMRQGLLLLLLPLVLLPERVGGRIIYKFTVAICGRRRPHLL